MTLHRKPSELAPPRMEPLARLPVFFALEGKRVIVEGTNAAAAWKVELMLAAGAHVALFASDPCAELLALTEYAEPGMVVLVQRAATLDDLLDAALAIGAFENDCDAAVFASLARAAGVPVNVIDKPAFCDFSFGAIVNRSPLVIGISTDGAAPIFAQAIRSKLEAMIPRGFAGWANAARCWRVAVQASGLSFGGRRRFWQHFVARAVAEPDRAPDEREFGELVASVNREPGAGDAGSVTLVGAGPGDPELLTLRAVRALQSADVILIDDLVGPEILDFARREARKMLIGKTGHGPSCKQEEINALMITLARAGKRVVRLKGGDPMVFGRAGEEIAACAVAGIAVEVVPGITAAQGAASRMRVSLTHRDQSRRVQFITGHDKHGRLAPDICWDSVADPRVTTAVYMPGKTIASFVETALANGLSPVTPAIAISRATRPDEISVATTIAALPECLADAQMPGPLLVMIGDVFGEKLAERRPKAVISA